MPARTVIKHSVQHNPYAQLVSVFDQGFQGFISAKGWIDSLVVCNLIFMVCGRAEHRGHVKRIDTQIHQIIQMLPNADKVTAIKTFWGRFYTPSGVHIAEILIGITNSESLRKNLVAAGSLDPLWHRHGITGKLGCVLEEAEISQCVVIGISQSFFRKVSDLPIRTG